MRAIIEQEQNAFASTYMVSVIMGVCLCILSPVAIFVSSAINTGSEATSNYGVAILLIIIAIAVFLFVYFGNIKESFSILLKLGDFSKEMKEYNKVIGVVAVIVWPLATCIFLVGGIIFHGSNTAWTVFPITGLLFGMFCAAYSTIKGHDN